MLHDKLKNILLEQIDMKITYKENFIFDISFVPPWQVL